MREHTTRAALIEYIRRGRIHQAMDGQTYLSIPDGEYRGIYRVTAKVAKLTDGRSPVAWVSGNRDMHRRKLVLI
jgi:hypothetical protein